MSGDVLLYRAHPQVSELTLYLTLFLVLFPWIVYRSVYDVVVHEMAWRRRDPDGFIRDVERARWRSIQVAQALVPCAGMNMIQARDASLCADEHDRSQDLPA